MGDQLDLSDFIHEDFFADLLEPQLFQTMPVNTDAFAGHILQEANTQVSDFVQHSVGEPVDALTGSASLTTQPTTASSGLQQPLEGFHPSTRFEPMDSALAVLHSYE